MTENKSIDNKADIAVSFITGVNNDFEKVGGCPLYGRCEKVTECLSKKSCENYELAKEAERISALSRLSLSTQYGSELIGEEN